jgi:hypothetical protein
VNWIELMRRVNKSGLVRQVGQTGLVGLVSRIGLGSDSWVNWIELTKEWAGQTGGHDWTGWIGE